MPSKQAAFVNCIAMEIPRLIKLPDLGSTVHVLKFLQSLFSGMDYTAVQHDFW